jgi:hypothetical protein
VSRRLKRTDARLFIAVLLDVLWYTGLAKSIGVHQSIFYRAKFGSVDRYLPNAILGLSIGVVHGLKVYILYEISVYEALKSLTSTV